MKTIQFPSSATTEANFLFQKENSVVAEAAGGAFAAAAAAVVVVVGWTGGQVLLLLLLMLLLLVTWRFLARETQRTLRWTLCFGISMASSTADDISDKNGVLRLVQNSFQSEYG